MHQTGLQPPATTDTRQALHEAIARYHRPLVAYALSQTGDLQRAQDAAQDTLLKLCQQPADKLGQDILPRLAPWLFTVCRNAVIDLHRKESRMPPGLSQAALTTTDPSPEERADTHDQQDHLLALVAGLPSHQREVVQLRFHGGLAYREIADVTGHSVSYVGVLLHDAIAALRQQLTALNA
ncbi:MAG: sigma-70 family RNA polymerase sigma factor [Phycisphaeraceae bacterium]|nr:sigma-70 family RNA polymerase sigma factor [Phycisphaeraceae bacterium]